MALKLSLELSGHSFLKRILLTIPGGSIRAVLSEALCQHCSARLNLGDVSVLIVSCVSRSDNRIEKPSMDDILKTQDASPSRWKLMKEGLRRSLSAMSGS